jgi:hypothetical protein
MYTWQVSEKEITMQQYPQQQYYAPPRQPGLGVGDGFKFGCGFFIAGAIAMLIFYIVGFVLFLLVGGVVGGILQEIIRQSTLVLPALLMA